MADASGYDVRRVVSRGPLGDVLVVAQPGGGVRLLRTVRIDPMLAGPEGSFARAARFFASLKRQQRVAAKTAGMAGPVGAGRGHVCAVHEVEATEHGGRALLDSYPLSAQTLIEGKAALPDYALYEVIAGVVHGLGLIGEAEHGRAHGALVFSAVQVDASAGPGKWRVGLTGLADGAAVDADGDRSRFEDLRNVGRLIYALVEHEPFRELGGYPVRDRGAWTGLGDLAPKWLALVNALLDPDAKPGRLRLADIAQQVAGLAAKPPKTKQRVQLAALVGGPLVLALIGGGAFWLFGEKPLPEAPFDEARFQTWGEAYDTWYPFYSVKRYEETAWPEVAGDGDAGRYLRDEVFELVRSAKRDIAVFDPGSAVRELRGERYSGPRAELLGTLLEEAATNDRIRANISGAENSRLGGQVDANVQLIEAISGATSAERWPARKALVDLAAAWEARGWTGPAAWAAATSGALTPDEGDADEYFAELKRVISASQMAAATEASWAGVAARIQPLAEAGAGTGPFAPKDVLLTDLAVYLERAIAAKVAGGAPSDAMGDDDAIEALRGALSDAGNALTAIEAVVGAGGVWTRVDREVFAAEAPVFASFASMEAADIKTLVAWAEQAREARFALPDPAMDPRVGEAWRGAVAALPAMRARLADLESRYPGEFAAEIPVFEATYGGRFASDIEAFGARVAGLSAEADPWRLRSRARVEAGTAALIADVAKLQGAVSQAANQIEVKWDELLLALGAETRIGGSAIGAVHAAWNARKAAMIAGFDPGDAATDDVRQRAAIGLRDATEAMRAWLVAVGDTASGTVVVEADAVPGGFDGAALEGVVSGRRELAAQRVIDGAGVAAGEAPKDGILAGLADDAAVERAWSASVEALIESCAAIEVLLEAAYLPGEFVEGVSLGVLVPRVLDDALLGSGSGSGSGSGLRAALGSVLDRAAGYRALMAEADTRALLLAAAGAGGAERRLAYDRLGSRDAGGGSWCSTADELDRDADAWAAVRTSAALLAGARRGDVEAWLDGVGRSRWDRAMAGAGGERAAVEAVLSLMGAYGIGTESLSGPARLNAEIYRGLVGIDQGMEDPQVRDAINTGLRSIEGSGAGVPGAVRSWLDAVRVVGEPPPPGFKAVDPADIGPAETGKWTLRQPYPEDFSSLTYTHNATGFAVTFVRVEGAGDTSDEDLFIAAEEMSIDGANALLEGDIAGYQASFSRGDAVKAAVDGETLWEGPRSWAWDARSSRFVANPEWVSVLFAEVSPYPPVLRDPREPSRVIATQRATGASPMNMMSPYGATWLAGRMGCDLPTARQWSAALSRFGGGGAGANLRDQTWATKRAWDVTGFVEAFRIATATPDAQLSPLKDAAAGLVPRELPGGADEDAATAGNDGVLWFAPVNDGGGGGPLRHMRGNVAELVRVPGEATGFGVIGDSSMSHPAADPTVPTVINRQARLVAGGVAEVGFRVSFSKTLSLTAGKRLAGLVSDPPYVAVDP